MSQLRDEVRRRAGDRCEYCQLPQELTILPHEMDHIRSQKHRGATSLENLCWACARRNDYKGSDATAYDPVTDGLLVPLFNPRQESWPAHFRWEGPVLIGETVVGRATIALLQINQPERAEHRRLLLKAGALPQR